MLAALIATRIVVPPPPPVFRYSNRLIAAINTFTCISVARRAAALTTSPPKQYQLILSMPGQESFFEQFNLAYFKLISEYATDGTDYLNATITQVVASAALLNTLLQTLPVADQSALTALQQQLAAALAALNALGVRVN